jgi:hypothetical protein
MLVKVKNPDLYREWIAHFERRGYKPFEARTFAFFNSQKGETPFH